MQQCYKNKYLDICISVIIVCIFAVYIKNMVIDKALLKYWANLRSPADTKEIAEKNNSYTERFNRAFRVGKCSRETFIIMAKFYQKKSKLVKSFKR